MSLSKRDHFYWKYTLKLNNFNTKKSPALVCSVHPPFAFCGGWLCLQGAATKWQSSCFEGDFSISNSKGSFLPLLIYALPPQEQQAKSHEAKSAKKGLKRSPDGHSHSAPSVSSRLAMQMIHEAFEIMLIKSQSAPSLSSSWSRKPSNDWFMKFSK